MLNIIFIFSKMSRNRSNLNNASNIVERCPQNAGTNRTQAPSIQIHK